MRNRDMKKLSDKTKKHIRIAIVIVAVYLAILMVSALLMDARRAEIELNGDEHMVLSFGEKYYEPGAKAYTNGNLFGAGQALDVTVSGEVNDAELGNYIVEYSASFLGKERKVTRSVSVVDDTAPVIELKTVEGYVPNWIEGYVEEGFTAWDDHDGDLTDKVFAQISADEQRVIYTVTDFSGNTSSVERNIDYGVSPPRIVLSGGENIELEASLSYTEPGYSAKDVNGNDLTDRVVVEGTVCPYVAGDYEIKYSITNDAGDSTVAIRHVKVTPVPKPDIVKPRAGTIYLTFDDGPGPYTDWLLDILEAYDVKATFFVTGKYPDYYDAIGRAYSEGHSVGIHTYNHDYYSIYASEEAFFKDFMATEELIHQQTGFHTKLCRFPGGSSNTVSSFNKGIMTRLSNALNSLGYKSFDWNVSSGDAGETTNTNQIIENIIVGSRDLSYSIVLQHDIKDYSVAAVESVIVWGLENGYAFEALDMTSPEAKHAIAN